MVSLQAGKDGLCIRALAVITPGNPTGQVIPRSNIEDLIKVSKKYEIAVIADEVYQVNVYNSNMKFDSFKKTIKDMGSEYDDVPLFSLQSISKGYYGMHTACDCEPQTLVVDCYTHQQECMLACTARKHVLSSLLAHSWHGSADVYTVYAVLLDSLVAHVHAASTAWHNSAQHGIALCCRDSVVQCLYGVQL